MKRRPINRIAVGLAALAALAVPAMAATETVLYSFPNSGSGYPLGRLLLENGSLYGTATAYQMGDKGQVFKLTNKGGSWKGKTLVTFDGKFPYAGLIRDSNGVLYGTTSNGDAYNFGGTVFELYKNGGKWVEHTIWAFGGTSGDGAQPYCDLVMDKSGNLYGTTYAGGTANLGTVFELSKVNGVWRHTVLHSFTGNGDGWEPWAGLLMVGSETFYGTTQYGGEPGGDGTVFKIFKSKGVWKLKQLYSFTGGADGGEPLGAVITDKNGNLYGTTEYGGYTNYFADVGTVFELVRSGNQWKEKVLRNFGARNDGWYPVAGLTWGPSGQLYGTAAGGGMAGGSGEGIVFELAQSKGTWVETILHDFFQAGDGSTPEGGVILDRHGALYGTTESGGVDDLGTVWKVTP